MSITRQPRGRVLIVDDDVAMGDFLVEGLETLGFDVEAVTTGERALERVRTGSFDVVVTDLRMKGMTGLELCRRLAERSAAVPVVMLTAFGDYAAAVEAVRAGAYDFLSKPVKLEVLDIAVARAVEQHQLRREVKRLTQSLMRSTGFGSLVGESPVMQEVYDLSARIASSDSSVLLTGESGTGKELVARALHAQGSRSSRSLVAINCAAMPENLLESELFGYEKGAFTDAKGSKAGLFVEADGGTLFLDEIGELPLNLQAKLLRALQERVVRPLGGRKEVPFDVRLIAATNRDLETAVEERRFREDLYFRINVIEVRLPPLRARGNDVVVLAGHFLAEFAERAKKRVIGLVPQVAERLLNYSWPGNVRELQNTIERAVTLAAHDHITLEDLPERITQHKRSHVVLTDEAELVTLEEMERRYILQVLRATGGSKSVAAKTLGLDRTTLWRKLERLRIEVPKRGD